MDKAVEPTIGIRQNVLVLLMSFIVLVAVQFYPGGPSYQWIVTGIALFAGCVCMASMSLLFLTFVSRINTFLGLRMQRKGIC